MKWLRRAVFLGKLHRGAPIPFTDAGKILESLGVPVGCGESWVNILRLEGVTGAVVAYLRSRKESETRAHVNLSTGIAIAYDPVSAMWHEPINLGLVFFNSAPNAVETDLRKIWGGLVAQGREGMPYASWRVSLPGQIAANFLSGRITREQHVAFLLSVLEQAPTLAGWRNEQRGN